MADAALAARPRRSHWLHAVGGSGAAVALVALLAFNLVATGSFLTLQTLNVNLTQVAPIVIVAVGMALVVGTGGIDVGAKAEILTLLRELSAEGASVLLIASELEELVAASDRIVVLREGRTVRELEGASINEAEAMRAMAHGTAGARTPGDG